ncbi:MAG: pectate lyase [Vicinamibacteraceae bacterium]|nr:pectate lyase [Vicinamibacteraceae bacterium]
MHSARQSSAIAAIGLATVFLLVGGSSDLLSRRDLGREVLAPDDGWAAEGAGTTGGAISDTPQVYVVTNRQELVAALNNGVYPPPSSTPSSQPKIIYVDGVIDANVDDHNQPLACTDYYRDGYTLEAYLATYDPDVWGRVPPSGPLETARITSRNAQMARVRIRVGSNTTIVGVDRRATIKGGWFDIRGAATSNIIIRNLRFVDTYDCFPAWAPTDGAAGNWNAEYDSISIRDGHHIWIDHNEFADVETIDSSLPTYFGRLCQVHDGQLDITNAASFVTVSWNRFVNHDKVMLIGSSDSATADRGRLKVTLHHNVFGNVGQRAPRVRFGQVHIYNNFYRIQGDANYQYSWGVGRESAIYAHDNFFRVDPATGVTPARFIAVFTATAIVTLGTQVNAASPNHVVDVRQAYNDARDPDLSDNVGWVPSLFGPVDPAFRLQGIVASGSGPFNW